LGVKYLLSIFHAAGVSSEEVALGHPNSKKFTPAIGRVNRIFHSGKTKYIELIINGAPGSSGSPVLNMKGEVVGIIEAQFVESRDMVAVHVEELREAIGLPNYNVPKNNYSPTIKPWSEEVIKPWSGVVYSTEYSHLFHRPDCSKLDTSEGLVVYDTPQKASKAGLMPCNYCKPS